MNRRALLSTIGVAALGGCAGLTADPEPTPTGTPTDSPTATERTTEPEQTTDEPSDLECVWRYDHGGWIDGFADGKVYCREHWIDEDSEGGVVALDSGTGERQWDYGFGDGYEFYSELLVEDAVYFGRGDDVVSSDGEVYSLGLNGTERWVHEETGSVYHAPRLVEGALYTVDDHGSARTFDSGSGEVLWETADLPRPYSPDVGVLHVGDVVFVKSRLLIGVDRNDGEVLWTYGDEDSTFGPQVTVADGRAYVDRSDEGVAMVTSDGSEVWRRDLDAGLRNVSDGWVILETAGETSTLYGLDAATGEERWSVQDFVYHLETCTEGRLIARDRDGEELHVYDAVDGTTLWSDPVSTDPVERVHAVEEDSAVYVETEPYGLHRVTPEGETTHSWSVESNVEDVTVEDGLYVGTLEHVYRLPLD